MIDNEDCIECIDFVRERTNMLCGKIKDSYECKIKKLNEKLFKTEQALEFAIFTLKGSNSDEQIIKSFELYIKELGYDNQKTKECKLFFKNKAKNVLERCLKEKQDEIKSN